MHARNRSKKEEIKPEMLGEKDMKMCVRPMRALL